MKHLPRQKHYFLYYNVQISVRQLQVWINDAIFSEECPSQQHINLITKFSVIDCEIINPNSS